MAGIPWSGKQYPIAAGKHAAVIVEVGAGLRSYTYDGNDVTCTYGEDELPPKCAGVALAPWPNRIAGGRYTFDGVEQRLALTEPTAGNAIHGLGRWERWECAAHADSRVTMRLDVVPQNGYPHQVRIDVTYELDSERGLTVTLAAQNVGTTRAPFGAGSHPYLSTRGRPLTETSVCLPAAEVLVVDDKQIPIGTKSVTDTPYDLRGGRLLGELRMDTGFASLETSDGRGEVEVHSAAGGARLWFDDAFKYLQVFTREDLTPGQHGIAVEPMTCAPNAFNSGDGLFVLAPGEQWHGSWGITPM